jgi:DNA-damage-inducible protein D
MTKAISKPELTVFEQIKQIGDEGIEFWSTRDLSKVLEYWEYRNFKPVIDKAKEACINSGQNVNYHFEDVLDMIGLGKGAKREVENVKRSRYACYLVIQNADPTKEVVALGQTYFAVQTRLQEI